MIEKSNFFSISEEIFEENGLLEFAKPEIFEKFYFLTEIMLRVNEEMNLTAITDPEAVILKHYADCLLIAKETDAYLPSGSRVVDIGCGAGFPCFPLAIARPDLEILGIDSTAKRIRYVNETASALGLTNLRAESLRAEDGSKKGNPMRESFDVATARAVAALPILTELCLPYVKKGGKFIAMKAKAAPEELESSKNAIKTLGGQLVSVDLLPLRRFSEEENRPIISVLKQSQTPEKYPRHYSQISKKPL